MAPRTSGTIRIGQWLVGLVRGEYKPNWSSVGNLLRVDSKFYNLISPSQLLLAALTGSLAGIGIIATIDKAVTSDAANSSIALPFIFIILLLVYRTSQLALLNSCYTAVELVMEETRLRAASKIISLDLISFENIQKEDIQAGFTKHFDAVYSYIIPVISGARSLALSIFLLIYLAWISSAAAAISITVTVIIATSYLRRIKELSPFQTAMLRSEIDLFAMIDEVFSGFKELKINYHKRENVLEALGGAVSKSAENRLTTSRMIIDLNVFVSVLNYLFAGSIVFLLPIISSHVGGQIAQIMAISLFLIAPMSSAVDAVHPLNQLKFCLNSIYKFEAYLDSLSIDPIKDISVNALKKIEIRQLTFARKEREDDSNFQVGPIDLTIKPKQIIFIEGGNGSGKTTMMKLITGLYPADGGTILVNGKELVECTLQSYRELFGVIFSDFHIFRKLYGYDEEKIGTLNSHLTKLGISHCVSLSNGENVESDRLSTGQKKRLALAILLTESPPIFVFDEWAADQDPHFRNIFYREILPQLKKEGKCVIAITHDDRYFDVADVRYHMEDGRMSIV